MLWLLAVKHLLNCPACKCFSPVQSLFKEKKIKSLLSLKIKILLSWYLLNNFLLKFTMSFHLFLMLTSLYDNHAWGINTFIIWTIWLLKEKGGQQTYANIFEYSRMVLLRLFGRGRLSTIIVIVRYLISKIYDARCIVVNLISRF